MYVCTFVLSSLAPFFRIGVTTASFHSDGKVPVAIDVLISLVIEVINNWVGGLKGLLRTADRRQKDPLI